MLIHRLRLEPVQQLAPDDWTVAAMLTPKFADVEEIAAGVERTGAIAGPVCAESTRAEPVRRSQ
jgi:hypothetical protein